MIDLLVEAGALVNGRSRYGNMPLHTAVRTSNRDAAATLIRAGADLDAVGTIAGDALTPALITSSVTGDIEMLRLLAHAGANLDAIPGTGADSVLEFAASRWASDRRREPADRLDFAREAIALGATVSHAVVKSAAETGDIQMLRLFEQHGAELTAYDEDGATLLWHVVRGRQRAGPAEPVIDLLLERGVDIDATGASGRTVLLEAVARRRESMVRVLLERGADPNLTDSTGAAPLDVAASAHSPSVVLTRLLLEHGAEPDLVCADGSPRFEKVHASVRSLIQAKVRKVNTDPRLKKLSEAVRLDDVATAHRLLAAGLDAEGERTPPRGETLLMGACSGAGAEMIRLLLEAGADVNARGASGYTALHRASESSHYVAAEILIESGADVNAADRYGETPVLLTRKTRDVRMLHLLAQSGADLHAGSLTGSSIIDGVVWRGDLEFVREAITLGVPIEHRNLVSAAQSGKTEMLRLLATLGGDLTARNRFGMTLLHSVVQTPPRLDPEPILDLLIENGVEIDAVNMRGRTPLHDAVDYRRTEITEMLLRKGADPNIADATGAAPLDTAVALDPTRQHLNKRPAALVPLLLDYGADPTLTRADGSPRFQDADEWRRERIEAAVAARVTEAPVGP